MKVNNLQAALLKLLDGQGVHHIDNYTCMVPTFDMFTDMVRV